MRAALVSCSALQLNRQTEDRKECWTLHYGLFLHHKGRLPGRAPQVQPRVPEALPKGNPQPTGGRKKAQSSCFFDRTQSGSSHNQVRDDSKMSEHTASPQTEQYKTLGAMSWGQKDGSLGSAHPPCRKPGFNPHHYTVLSTAWVCAKPETVLEHCCV